MVKSVFQGSIAAIILLLLRVSSGFAVSPLLQSSGLTQTLLTTPSLTVPSTSPTVPSVTPQPTMTPQLATPPPTSSGPPSNITVDTKGSDWTVVVSVIAVCISLASLVVSLLVYLRDRSNLIINKVEFSKGHGMEFLVWVVNKGRRPVLIEEVLLRLNSGKTLHVHARGQQPDALGGDGERKRFDFRVFEHAGEFDSPLDIVQAEVYDTTRKKVVYKFSNDFREEIEQKWTPELAENFANRK